MSMICWDAAGNRNILYVKVEQEGIFERWTEIMFPDAPVQPLSEQERMKRWPGMRYERSGPQGA